MIKKTAFTLALAALSTSAIPALTLAVPATAAAAEITGSASDAELSKALLGTWQAVDTPDAKTINGESTLTADGKGVGYTTATETYGNGTSADIKIHITFNWRVEHGVAILDHFKSDPPHFLPDTQVYHFQILKITDTGVVYKDKADGQEVYRRRK